MVRVKNKGHHDDEQNVELLVPVGSSRRGEILLSTSEHVIFSSRRGDQIETRDVSRGMFTFDSAPSTSTIVYDANNS